MAQLVLTGLSNDFSIDDPDRKDFFLVFNNGALRVPISEEAIEVVLAFVGSQAREEEPVHTNGSVSASSNFQVSYPPEDTQDYEEVPQF